MSSSAEAVPKKVTKILSASTFLGGLGGSLMPFLFNYSLVTEQGFSLNLIAIILLAGPIGLLVGNRLLVPTMTNFSPKFLMITGHLGFAVSLCPILAFPSNEFAIILCLFLSFLFNSLYLPARSEYIFFLGKVSGSAAAVSFRSNLRFLSYFATGLASVAATIIITFGSGFILLWAIISNVTVRLICAVLIGRLPAVTNWNDTNDEAENPTQIGSTSSSTKVPMSYIFTTVGLLITASLCGSFAFFLPLVAAQFHITGDTFFPIILGAMTIFAGILHRSNAVKSIALSGRNLAVISCLFASGIAFGTLTFSLNGSGISSLIFSTTAIIVLTMCNVVATTVQWEFSYSMRTQATTRRYEAIDNLIQTCIGLLLPSGMSLFLGLLSLNLFLYTGLILAGVAIVGLVFTVLWPALLGRFGS